MFSTFLFVFCSHGLHLHLAVREFPPGEMFLQKETYRPSAKEAGQDAKGMLCSYVGGRSSSLFICGKKLFYYKYNLHLNISKNSVSINHHAWKEHEALSVKFPSLIIWMSAAELQILHRYCRCVYTIIFFLLCSNFLFTDIWFPCWQSLSLFINVNVNQRRTNKAAPGS